MNMKKGFIRMALFFLAVGCGIAQAGDTVMSYWINPAYQSRFSPEDLVRPKLLKSDPTQYTCTSQAEVTAYLKENYEARNVQIVFNMIWDFQFSDVVNILAEARADATRGDDYLAYCIIGENQGLSGMDGDVLATIAMTYVATYEQELAVNDRVAELLPELIDSEMNPEARGKAIHDWIVTNVQYDTEYIHYSAWAALFLGKTVCQGYSLLAHKMLDEVGVPVRIIENQKDQGETDHAWNMVNLCGNWYHMDATWDDPVPDEPDRVLYDYFNLSDNELENKDDGTHVGWRLAVPDAPEAPVSYVAGVCDGVAAPLLWVTDKDIAMALASNKGKRVLLLAGRATDGFTREMQDTVCESTEPPVHDAIAEGYVPWYCDIDESTAYTTYAGGLGTFDLPLICRIDPAMPDQFIDRSTGIRDPQGFYERLLADGVLNADVDRWNGVELRDAILALQTLVGVVSSDVHADADVNGDFRIGLEEAVFALQKVAGVRQ